MLRRSVGKKHRPTRPVPFSPPDSVEAAAHARLDPAALAPAFDVAAGAVLRYGLVATLVLFGAFKFTAVEPAGIEALVRHSPLLSWLHALTSARGASDVIGVIELLGAALWSAGETCAQFTKEK